MSTKPTGWHGISGWLAFASLGLLASPVVLIYQFSQVLQGLSTTTVVEQRAYWLLGSVVALLLLYLVTLYNFFQLKKITPTLAITAYLASVVYIVIFFRPDMTDTADTARFLIGVLANLGWMLYFDKSERVVNTFSR